MERTGIWTKPAGYSRNAATALYAARLDEARLARGMRGIAVAAALSSLLWAGIISLLL